MVDSAVDSNNSSLQLRISFYIWKRGIIKKTVVS